MKMVKPENHQVLSVCINGLLAMTYTSEIFHLNVTACRDSPMSLASKSYFLIDKVLLSSVFMYGNKQQFISIGTTKHSFA